MNEIAPTSVEQADRRRRRVLYAAAAAAAGLAGAGVAWWRYTPAPLADTALQQFWGMEFATPAGTPLAMQTFRGRPLLVNFWATWCPPCIEELPLLNAFFDQNAPKGWQVLGIAVDKAGPVRAFMERQPLAFPVVLAGMDGLTLSKNLGNLAGGLPFTVVLGSSGRVLERKIGKVSERELQAWQGLKWPFQDRL